MKRHVAQIWVISGISICCLLSKTGFTLAQLIQDTTLPVNSTVNTSGNINTITGGTEAGSNLFHSFQQFNIGEGQKANFVSSSAAIENILVRVTGGSRSEILGTIGTSGLSNPNLFLINPNGIVFGANASLDIRGSFVATTANTIGFGNQGLFSASAPNPPGLLTINPSAFLFNQVAAQSIINQSVVGLNVPNAQSLLLVGGDVNVDRGVLQAPGGRIELGGVAGSGTVDLQIERNNLRLSYPTGVQRSNVSLTNDAEVSVIAGGSGSIAIAAQNLSLAESSLQAGIESVGSQAGDITLDAIEAMTIANSSISNDISPGAVGNTGGIYIKAESLTLTDDAELSSQNLGQGETKGLFLQANKSVSITNSSLITKAGELGVGNAGDISIQAESLSLVDALLETSTTREGRAGNINIAAQDSISIGNKSLISSDTFGQGNGGIIEITARKLSLNEGAVLLSRTTGQGNAGNIQINAADSVSISGVDPLLGTSTGLVTATEGQNSGSGNNISITTGNLRISDAAVLSARTRSASRGGDITVNVNNLELTNGGQILTSAYSNGRAGTTTVNATDKVTIAGSDPTFNERLAKFGQRRVDNDGSNSGLFARVRGNVAANAGEIKVTAGSLHLNNQGTISTATTLGEGGNITLKAKDILLRNYSSVTATAGTIGAGGNGGNIDINTDLFIALGNSDITANAFQGKGGNIRIKTQGLLRSSDSDITASSQFGVDGVVEINTPDVEPNPELAALPTDLVDVSGLIAQGCVAGGGDVARTSEFIITGRGGLPPSPSDLLTTDAVRVDLYLPVQAQKQHHSAVVSTNSTDSELVPLVEAQGWIVSENGQVVLTAQAPTVTANSSWLSSLKCNASF